MSELYLSGERPMSRLVDELDEVFPPLTIDPSMSHELILYRAGERSVVEWIKAKLESES